MNKSEIRNYIKNQFAISDQVKASVEAKKATDHLTDLLLSRNKKKVLIYSSLKDELNTLSFIENQTKYFEIYLPKVVSEEKLSVHKVDSYKSDLKLGSYGILEPVTKALTNWVDEIDAIVVPARAIDFEGNRLGRGKGYYDRLLIEAKAKKILIIGLLFKFQWIDSLPSEAHDVCVSYVVTEKGSFQIRK